MARAFIDSNVLLHLLSADTIMADAAESIVDGGVISVQVLNEISDVARRRLGMSWAETHEMLGLVRSICSVRPLDIETHEHGMRIAERYKLSIYDGLIVGSALLAECSVLYSADMRDGLMIDKQLRIRNPFTAKRTAKPDIQQ